MSCGSRTLPILDGACSAKPKTYEGSNDAVFCDDPMVWAKLDDAPGPPRGCGFGSPGAALPLPPPPATELGMPNPHWEAPESTPQKGHALKVVELLPDLPFGILEFPICILRFWKFWLGSPRMAWCTTSTKAFRYLLTGKNERSDDCTRAIHVGRNGNCQSQMAMDDMTETSLKQTSAVLGATPKHCSALSQGNPEGQSLR